VKLNLLDLEGTRFSRFSAPTDTAGPTTNAACSPYGHYYGTRDSMWGSCACLKRRIGVPWVALAPQSRQ